MLTSLPNLLTLSRILVIPLIVATFYIPGGSIRWIACALFVAAAITDFFDGYVARRRNIVSSLGRFLDPIADKLLVSVALMMLVAFRRLPMPTLLPALVILSREILVSGLREFLAGLRVSLPVSRLAKWKTGIQMVALGTLLIDDAGPVPLAAIGQGLLWMAAILTLVTGYDYLRAGLRYMDADAAVPAEPAGGAPDPVRGRP